MSLVGNITGFQHLGIPVSDLEKSIHFYEHMGFRIENRSEFKETGGVTRVAFMELGNFCLELYQTPEGVAVSRDAGPIDHFALDVRDIDEAFQVFKEEGFSIVEDKPVFLPLRLNGVKYFMVLGPDGEKVELNQLM